MKNHHHQHPIHPHAAGGVPPHEAIAVRAYELWEAQGHPADSDKSIWLEAEAQLVALQHPLQRNLSLSTDS